VAAAAVLVAVVTPHLTIDTASSTPPYEQLRDQLARYIVSGQLAAGSKLPAIRQLAQDLGLAPGTIARAYTDLERAGLTRTRRPQGSFVTDHPDRNAPEPARLTRLAEAFAAQARQLGVGQDDAITALRGAFRAQVTP
jgi:DNA-binding transcriptional regulator YhcF (GntR family)